MDEERMTVEDKVRSLMEMGFIDEANIRRQLTRAKNDLSLAVSYLTDDDGGGWNIGPQVESQPTVSTDLNSLTFDSENVSEFPETHLYDLMDRSGGQNTWTIPYQRHESLGVLLNASTQFLERGQLDDNSSMKQFLFQVLPDCIEKLTMSNAVTGWKEDVVTGVLDMLILTVEMVACYAVNQVIPTEISSLSVKIFDKNSKFHNNPNVRHQKSNKIFVQQHMNNTWITPTPSSPFSLNLGSRGETPGGWLVDLVNHFAVKNGFESLAGGISPESDYVSLANCLAPIAILSDVLTSRYLSDLMSKRMTATFQQIVACDDATLKSSQVTFVFDILRYLHRLYYAVDSTQLEAVEACYFDLLLRMVSLQNFGTRMNSLKQVLSLFEVSQKHCSTKPMFTKDAIVIWLNKSAFIGHAMSSNLDHAQYCERLGKVLECMGSQVSKAHLRAVCDRLRSATNDQATENIANLLIQIIPRSGSEKLKEFLKFLQESWVTSDEWSRAKILRLFDKVASGTRYLEADFYQSIVDCVWHLAMAEANAKASNDLVSKIMETHLQMIREPGHNCRIQIWRQYALRCFSNMQQHTLVYLSARHLLSIIKPNGSYLSKEIRTILKELEDKGLVELLLNLIDSSVGRGIEKVITTGAPDDSQFVSVLLDILRQVITNSESYLSLDSMGILWKSLVDREAVSPAARNHVYRWLRDTVRDSKSETKRNFFTNYIMRSMPKLCSDSNEESIECFKEYFIHCNTSESNIVENIDKSHYVQRPGLLIGMECAWFAALSSREDFMALKWSTFVVDFLVHKLHRPLVAEANIGAVRLAVVRKCLSLLLEWMPENALPTAVRRNLVLAEQAIAETIVELAPNATWLTQGQLAPGYSSKEPSSLTISNEVLAPLQLRRSLEFMAYFISNIDSRFVNARIFPPHQVSFVGAPVTIRCVPTTDDVNNNVTFDIHTHSNEVFGVIRSSIAKQLDCSSSSVEARHNDSGKVILPDKDMSLLASVGLGMSNVTLNVKKVFTSPFSRFPSVMSSTSSTPFFPPLSVTAPHDEALLVGVGISKISSFYHLLYLLLTESDHHLAATAMNLLQLLPTDPSVSAILTSLPSQLGTPSPMGTTTGSLSTLSIGAASPSKQNCISFFSESSLDLLLCADKQPPLLLLYNLQALCANLMPVSSAEAPVATTEGASAIPSSLTQTESQAKFCLLFIQFDGLHRLAELLYHQKLLNSEDITAKQESLRLILRLMKHLLLHVSDEPDTSVEMSSSCDIPASSPTTLSSPIKKHQVVIPSSPRSKTSLLSSDASSMIASNLDAVQNQQIFESLIRLCWATASGKLHAHSTNASQMLYQIAAGHSVSNSSGSDQSSANTPTPGATISATPRRLMSSSDEHALTTTDVELAKESLELSMLLIRTQSSLYTWFCNQPFAIEFITAILVHCPSATIRQLTRRELRHFAINCKYESPPGANDIDTSYQHPIVFLIDKLLKARVPFWSGSAIRRGISQRFVSQCDSYFDLLADLIKGLSSRPSIVGSGLPFDACQQLEFEMEWLDSFSPSSDDPFMRLQRLDDLLLAGHLSLMSSWVLFMARSVNGWAQASTVGRELIPRLFDICLLLSERFFRSFKTDKTRQLSTTIYNGEVVTAKCSGPRARQATLDLIVSLAQVDPINTEIIAERLTDALTILPLDVVTEHFRHPVIPPKSTPGGFVGMKNAGATCYMNAVIQQLFMIPKLSDAVMSVSVPSSGGADNRSLQLVYELQKIFAYLQKSTQQFYVPEGFWRNFGFTSDSGINVREHQDAFDFFTALVDTIDEALKKVGQSSVLAPFFKGLFVDEKVCDGCPHRFRTDCPFFSISLPVASGSLEQSLQQYVKSERLEGENPYFCEKCQTKRPAVKRLALKQLPPVICFQLKRFYYDWERGVPQKFDTHFTFPWTLDIEPYTEEGIVRQDNASGYQTSQMGSSSTPAAMDTSCKGDCDASSSSTESSSHSTYQLVGIVVHSGQSNAGHYYSLIRDRRKDSVLNPNYGRWFNFNDTEVKEFTLDDSNIEHECFGGTYYVTDNQSVVNYSGERVRSWSAYLLFYEHVETPSATARYAKRTRMSENVNYHHQMMPPLGTTNVAGLEPSASCRVAAQRLDSLAELSLLLQQGEVYGLFGGTIPGQLLQQIMESNAFASWFLNLHDDSFWHFLESFVYAACDTKGPKRSWLKAVDSTTEMLLTYFFSILLPAYPSAITDKRLANFLTLFETYFNRLKDSALSSVPWTTFSSYIERYLLSNLEESVRKAFREIVSISISAFFRCFKGNHIPEDIKRFFALLLDVLPENKDGSVRCFGSPTSPANHPFSLSLAEEYFRLWFVYFTSSPLALTHALVDLEALNRFMSYLLVLLGSGSQSGPQLSKKGTGTNTRNIDAAETGIVTLWQESVPPSNASSAVIYRQHGPACDYLHRCLATLLCGCDLTSTKSEKTWKSCVNNPSPFDANNDLSLVPLEHRKSVPILPNLVPLLPVLVSEVVTFSCEIDSGAKTSKLLETAFVHLCTGSLQLSTTAIQCLLSATAKAPTSHLRPVVSLLQSLLRCNDSLHSTRVKMALDGFSGSPGVPGLLDMINEFRSVEGRRAYQAMKIICEVSTLSEAAKQLLTEREACWTGAVDWLTEVLSGSGTTTAGSFDTPASAPMSPQPAQPTVKATTEASTTISPDSKSFLRTESACSTLRIARDLLRPASSDTSSTVTQLIDSPVEQDSPPVDTMAAPITEEPTVVDDLPPAPQSSPTP